MGSVEDRWGRGISRRRAILALGGMLAGTPLALRAQLDPRGAEGHRRTPSLGELVEVFDFEPICFDNIPRSLYDFTAQGSDSEWTLRRNRHAFDWVDLIPRPEGPLPGAVDTSIRLFGTELSSPILAAPTANQGHLHPSAEGGMYEATTATGTLLAVSHNATLQQEAIAAAATGPRWIQIYPNMNMQSTRNTLDRFLAAGAQAIIVTVDQQAVFFERAGRNRWLGASTSTFGQGRGGGAPLDTLTGPRRYGVPSPGRLWFTWDFMSEMRDYLDVPFLIKGILSPDDARIAVERGFDGIIVSNHGGRSLDYAPSTLEVLPEIADAVGGQIPVLMDGGIRRGSDIYKALALGADAVLAGRALRWGLGAFGPPGAQRVIEILQAELSQAMSLTGRSTLASIDPSSVRVDFP